MRVVDVKNGKRINTSITGDLSMTLQDAISSSNSMAEAAKKLDMPFMSFKRRALELGLYKTNQGGKGVSKPFKGVEFTTQDILDGKHPDFPIHRLKDKLIRSGIKKLECEQCGFHERRITDGKIPLLLNFEDNNNKNHKIENIRMLCYNCTFTSGKGYISKGPKVFDPDILQDSKKILKQRF